MTNRGMVEDGLSTLTPTQQDALSITGWLAWRKFRPTPIVPASAVDGIWLAHDNPDAWPLVDLPDGLTARKARALMVAARRREIPTA